MKIYFNGLFSFHIPPENVAFLGDIEILDQDLFPLEKRIFTLRINIALHGSIFV